MNKWWTLPPEKRSLEMYYFQQDKCLDEAEFVALMVDLWGGSWQRLYQKLTEKGYKLVKS